MPTTAGTLAAQQYPADAFIITQIKDKAIILGKTNLSEWANFLSSWANG
jgi:Asp-tRNA(Asn)/Glu-tRNA(Gln) amidotransferase A subunit family amidase